MEGWSSVSRGDLGEVRGPGPKGLIGGCCGGGELIGNSRAPVNRVRASYIIYYNDGRRGCGGGGGGGRRGEAAAVVNRLGGPERVRGTRNTQTHTYERSRRLSGGDEQLRGFGIFNGLSGQPDQCVAANWLRVHVRCRRSFRCIIFVEFSPPPPYYNNNNIIIILSRPL